MKKTLFLSILLISLNVAFGTAVFAEIFRVDKVFSVNCDGEGTSEKVSIGVNDSLAIFLPENMTFVKGLELSIKIPSEVAQWRDSVAYSVYEKISPSPKEDVIDYEGTRLTVGTFPSRLSTSIIIPFSENEAIKESPYSVKIPVLLNPASRYVFFRLQLAMKGASEDIEKSRFEIGVKPVLSDEGRLSLKIKVPEIEDKTQSENFQSSSYTVFIDEKNVSLSGFYTPDFLEKGIVLKTGEHHLSVVSDAFRNEIRSFRIDKARTTAIEISLRDIAPTVKIICPENAEVIFDGEILDRTKSDYMDDFPVAAGEHSVTFKIGDYEILKVLNAENGRSYTVNLSINAEITEND